MVNYCAVPGCTNRGGHRFPKESNLQRKWEVAIKRDDPRTKQPWRSTSAVSSVVCRAHFVADDYEDGSTSRGRHIYNYIVILSCSISLMISSPYGHDNVLCCCLIDRPKF